LVALIIVSGGGLAVVVWLKVSHSLRSKVYNIIDQHVTALSRRRAQLVRRDAYGTQVLIDWETEVDYFITTYIEPSLTPFQRMLIDCRNYFITTCIESSLTPYQRTILVRKYPTVKTIIFERVEAAIRDRPASQTFSLEMTPAEFETRCAEVLRRAGWNACVTSQTRDQGVDVVAEKGRIRVVLQCKLWAQPVGNKAVQEAAAGKAHEQADYGIVVTNNRYTPAAEQLAATNGVLLLHYSDLQNLEGLLSQKPRSTPPF
jgi:restriction system protein